MRLVISGIRDFYVVPGSELDEEGDYFLRYVAEDGYGLKTVKEAHVLVATAEAIQDLNGNRQIDYRRDTILGAHNIYDVGQRLTKILTRDDVVDADDAAIGDDVKEKLLRFGRAAVAAASMIGKSYLQIGSICMGIGGSIIDSDFLESYLGLRVESVDEVEIIRRMSERIYDETEYQKALHPSIIFRKSGRIDIISNHKTQKSPFEIKSCVI